LGRGKNRVKIGSYQRRTVSEAMVKLTTFVLLVAGTLLALSPASAQTYDPRYPICMHVYGEKLGDRMDCIFTSLGQCAATASGLPATCLINPYYVHAGKLSPAYPHRAR
jgi:hypothetical protein